MNKPIIGITMGDPAGIGPEVAAKTIAEENIYKISRPLLIGDASTMIEALKIAKTDLSINPINQISEAKFSPGSIDIIDLKNVDLEKIEFGKISAKAGKAAFEAVHKVIKLALENKIAATVTGPINKESIQMAGFDFPGHTEIYAHYTKTQDYAMLLVYENLRVIHVSTHVSLKRSCELVKKDRILKVIKLLNDACIKFGIQAPRIGVAGLNPHASDGGLFGAEERKEILPAIKQANASGYIVEGPYPPDILFPMAQGGHFDGCVAMYHDQGHIPFKLMGFDWDSKKQSMGSVRGVNITTGLPIIRTSVDHGTAFEIAGKGIASPESMIYAIEYAVKLALVED
jgi:4-phospho-D-threonate 3-dehydrogenase / 4-phospho-D-erythronate 3-dehydrogenase